MAPRRDPGLDDLLALDGVSFFVDAEGKYIVRFVVKEVETSKERPHGVSYSLTLHDEGGDCLVGFDNAHQVAKRGGPSGRQRSAYDHRHRFRTIRPYDYRDAAGLLVDFWDQVDRVLKERGVLK
jgi:hypothetical protein